MSTKEKLHAQKAALRFLENLYEEICLLKKIEDIQNPLVLKKFKEAILVLQNTLSTEKRCVIE